jgi:hypothetical protein
MTNVDPVMRPATQKPARIFFRSFASITASFKDKGDDFSPGGGNRKANFIVDLPNPVLKDSIHSLFRI